MDGLYTHPLSQEHFPLLKSGKLEFIFGLFMIYKLKVNTFLAYNIMASRTVARLSKNLNHFFENAGNKKWILSKILVCEVLTCRSFPQGCEKVDNFNLF